MRPYNAKLTPEQVLQIRSAAKKRQQIREWLSNRYGNRALAKKYGVHYRTIENTIAYTQAYACQWGDE